MKNDQLHNIFSKDGSSVSLETIKRYVDGTMSPDEMHSFEQLMNEDPFLNDAVEGYQHNPEAFGRVPELNDKIKAKSSPKIKNIKGWLMSGGLAIAACLTILILFKNENSIPENINEGDNLLVSDLEDNQDNIEVITFNSEDYTYIDIDPNNLEKELKQIDVMKAIPEEDQITYNIARENQPTTKTEKDFIKDDIDLELAMEETEELNQETRDGNTIETIVSEEANNRKVELSNAHLVFYKDLKMVDYSNIYAKDVAKSRFKELDEMTEHIEAKFESMEEQSENRKNPEIVVEHIPYQKFINSAVQKYIDKKYNDALKDFKIVAKQFPDDVNAAFYGALCYYNLGKYNSALIYFDQVHNHSYNSFKSEAEYYKALSYLGAKRSRKGRLLLEKIVSEKGLYAEKADKKLKELKRIKQWTY